MHRLKGQEINKERVFDVYLIVYANTSDQIIGSRIYQAGALGNTLITNAGHFALLIDLAGETPEGEYPKGMEVHEVIWEPEVSQETSSMTQVRSTKSEKAIKTIKIGNAAEKLSKICRGNSRTTYKLQCLSHYYFELFENFIQQECEGDYNWSKLNNCHKFTKYCVQDLSLEWPESIGSPLDDYPFLLDFWSISQKAKVKSNETSSYSSSSLSSSSSSFLFKK
ncbi:hypothetical protein CYY_010301 [Polysphondylium violaceum]|uniref:Uncharacterized protein n=1 Tax=Polysphondylium violaceum TaxID=133409 RepID=A0A8J4PKV2_9MYCE|nr:hypothetical protein CYY_010301 [Polysphondylium violaceum]